MRFQTPQFIEVKDKIFGPFTLRQFIYMAGGAGLSIVVYTFAPIKFLAWIVIIPTLGLVVALTFYKIHGRPFIDVLESAFTYFVGSRLYLWKKVPRKIEKSAKKEVDTSAFVPRLSDSKLKDLSWSLDIQDIDRNPLKK
ncbi:hypothetical protein COB55_05010 [Candidatus Wolfebacteria bacterium]|nr:MAG: hypothetical protein COB55_05010 [Candidatus Wolfebacteria bacterium]